MLAEYIDRVITEIKRIGDWPRIEQVREAMEKVRAEMEHEAIIEPIAVTVQAAAPEIQGSKGPEPLDLGQEPEPAIAIPQPEPMQPAEPQPEPALTPLDEASAPAEAEPAAEEAEPAAEPIGG